MTTITTTITTSALLVACGGEPGARVPPAQASPAAEVKMDAEFPLTWTLTPQAGALSVTWHIENRTAASVWLLDEPYVPVVGGYERFPDRITALASERDPSLLRLVRGHLRPPAGQGVAVEYTPVARALPAGASADGQATLALPLRPWHPYYTTFPWKTAPKRASLELGVLVGDPPEGVTPWEPFVSVPDGAQLQVPSLGYVVQRQRLVAGEVKAIP